MNWFKPKLPSVQKWEYMVMPFTSGDNDDVDLLDHKIMLNGIGQAGWELICIHRDHMIFKKPYVEV